MTGAASSEFKSFHFSSRDFAEPDRVEAYFEAMGRAILRIETEPHADHPLCVDLDIRGGDDFGIAVGSCSPMRNRHLASLADNDDVVLVVVRSGVGVAAQCGRETGVSDGQAILTTNGEAGTFTGHTATRLLNFRFKRSLLGPRVADLGAVLMRSIPASAPALRLLLSYGEVVEEGCLFTAPEIVNQMYDLAAMTLGPTREAGEIAHAEDRGVRAARLAAIKADIQANYAVHTLCVADVAARQGVTTRYVQMLFEAEGTTFSEALRNERLQSARRMLTDTRFMHLNVSELAYRCGFSDLSYFNRSFRRYFGDTPSGVRRSRGA